VKGAPWGGVGGPVLLQLMFVTWWQVFVPTGRRLRGGASAALSFKIGGPVNLPVLLA